MTASRRSRISLLPWAALLAACAAPAVESDPAAPVRELIARVRAAEEARNYGPALREIHPDQQAVVVWAYWFDAAYKALGADPKVVSDYRTLVETHGLDEAWLSADATGPGGVERVAAESLAGVEVEPLFADLVAFSDEHGRFDEAFGFLHEVSSVTLDGERASARIGEREFRFQLSGGRWTWLYLPERD